MNTYNEHKTTLQELAEAMKEYNATVAPGSECTEWGDFVADCYDQLGMPPWDDRAAQSVVPNLMRDYWLAVADGQGDYQ